MLRSWAVSDLLWYLGLWPIGLLCLWDSPGHNPGVGCHFLPQKMFPTHGSNPRLLHWQVDSLPLAPPGKPSVCCWLNNSIYMYTHAHRHKCFNLTPWWVDFMIENYTSLEPLQIIRGSSKRICWSLEGTTLDCHLIRDITRLCGF